MTEAVGPSIPVTLVPGAELPALQAGPFTLGDFVRWAGYQENWIRTHYDAAYARDEMGLAGPIQSGHHRTALLARMVTDWVGPSGWLRRLAVRHTGQVRCGDVVRCQGRVLRVRTVGGQTTEVEVEIWAVGANGRRVSEGSATVEVRQ